MQVTFFLLGSGQNWSSEFLPLSKFLQFSFLLSCKYFLGTQKIFCHGAIVFPPLGIAAVDVKSEPRYCMFCGPSTSIVSLSEGSIGPSTGKTSCFPRVNYYYTHSVSSLSIEAYRNLKTIPQRQDQISSFP